MAAKFSATSSNKLVFERQLYLKQMMFIYITMDLTEYAATQMRIHNDALLPNILTIVTLARPKYELPDDGHRPKHVGAFYYEF